MSARAEDEPQVPEGQDPALTAEAQRVLLRALKVAQDAGDECVATKHLLLGVDRETKLGPLLVKSLLKCTAADDPGAAANDPQSGR